MANELLKVCWYYNLIQDVSHNKIICPFHEDVNPSMMLDFENNRWFCFGCQLSGDAAKMVQLIEKKYNNLNDLSSYIKYKKILNSDKCSELRLQNVVYKKKKPQRELYTQAYDYYHGLKKIDWNNHEFEEVTKCLSYMEERGFDSYILNKCKAKVTFNNLYPIIFPMLDNGKFKGWVCRTNDKNTEKKRKYLYNEGFSRANTLVGDYGSKSYVFVVEGYMDRLKFVQFGQNNVVAILGWKMSTHQIEKLKSKGIKTIISALDNDECGKKGTIFLKKHFRVIRFKYLKGIKDPGEMNKRMFDTMLRKTLESFKEEKNNGFN